MLNVTLYTRKNCKLCDEVKTELQELQSKYPHRLVEVDIETDSSLMAEWAVNSIDGFGGKFRTHFHQGRREKRQAHIKQHEQIQDQQVTFCDPK